MLPLTCAVFHWRFRRTNRLLKLRPVRRMRCRRRPPNRRPPYRRRAYRRRPKRVRRRTSRRANRRRRLKAAISPATAIPSTPSPVASETPGVGGTPPRVETGDAQRELPLGRSQIQGVSQCNRCSRTLPDSLRHWSDEPVVRVEGAEERRSHCVRQSPQQSTLVSHSPWMKNTRSIFDPAIF